MVQGGRATDHHESQESDDEATPAPVPDTLGRVPGSYKANPLSFGRSRNGKEKWGRAWVRPAGTPIAGSEQAGLRVRLARRLSSMRDSQRIASLRTLLKNATAWEQETAEGTAAGGLPGEWLAPRVQMPPKLMGSFRLARAVEIIGGWRGLRRRLQDGEAPGAEQWGPEAEIVGGVFDAEAEGVQPALLDLKRPNTIQLTSSHRISGGEPLYWGLLGRS